MKLYGCVESMVNNTFVKMMEFLEYDIELHFVKRKRRNEADVSWWYKRQTML